MIFEGPGSESGRPFEITVPEKLVPPLEYYLQEVRPKFTGMTGSWTAQKAVRLPQCYRPDHHRAKPRRLRGTGQPTPLPALRRNDDCNPPARKARSLLAMEIYTSLRAPAQLHKAAISHRSCGVGQVPIAEVDGCPCLTCSTADRRSAPADKLATQCSPLRRVFRVRNARCRQGSAPSYGR
jgi:hypothetical protein